MEEDQELVISLKPVNGKKVQFAMERARASLLSPTDSDTSSASSTPSSTPVLGERTSQAAQPWKGLIPPGRGGGSLLRRACRAGDVEHVRHLVAAGASIHSYDEVFERTALHYAAAHGRAECVRFLRSLGADPEMADIGNQTALHLAAERGHTAAIEALTDGVGGASVDRRTSNGSLALHHAAAKGHASATLALLAVMRDRGEVQTLTRLTAFMDIDGCGLTASDLARQQGHIALADAIDLAATSEAAAADAARMARKALVEHRARLLSAALRDKAKVNA
eukprot:CAMPEP_0174753068 /NCGR_PEP_ID=MMETSP1094-20130205/103342_1 /TAXON_ID=156173 /ORGANISM="Chrysochromulina brevifilum, Strain UTEX LB 985" /LENGTH=279 /DNA_ID=CAMNT_0015958781 /DNA_START=20 /DNA_END=859 /DNA_ORIENTATION=+